MKVLIYFTSVLLSFNVLKTKKYLIEVAEDEMADSQKAENPACKCGVERDGRRRIVGGTEVNHVRYTETEYLNWFI